MLPQTPTHWDLSLLYYWSWFSQGCDRETFADLWALKRHTFTESFKHNEQEQKGDSVTITSTSSLSCLKQWFRIRHYYYLFFNSKSTVFGITHGVSEYKQKCKQNCPYGCIKYHVLSIKLRIGDYTCSRRPIYEWTFLLVCKYWSLDTILLYLTIFGQMTNWISWLSA